MNTTVTSARKAESEVRQVVEPALVLRSKPLRELVARIEQSEIREEYRSRIEHRSIRATMRKTIGGETPTDARLLLPCLTDTAAPLSGEAHIYRRSTAALVPGSLSSQGTQHQASASWDAAEGWWPLRRAGVTRLYLSQSSEAIAARS